MWKGADLRTGSLACRKAQSFKAGGEGTFRSGEGTLFAVPSRGGQSGPYGSALAGTGCVVEKGRCRVPEKRPCGHEGPWLES